MIFEYDQQPVFMQNIEVDDIGNVALRCSNQKMQEYYIVTKTYLGKTFILKFGPLFSEIETLVDNLELSFKKVDYRESIIIREINKYLQDGRNLINKVEIIPEYTALAALPTADQFLNSL